MNQDLIDGTSFRQAGNAITRVIQGETVLLTPEDSSVHVLDEVGSRIWDLCAEPVSIPVLVAGIASEYEVSEEQARQDICDFLNQLIDLGVVREDGSSAG